TAGYPARARVVWIWVTRKSTAAVAMPSGDSAKDRCAKLVACARWNKRKCEDGELLWVPDGCIVVSLEQFESLNRKTRKKMQKNREAGLEIEGGRYDKELAARPGLSREEIRKVYRDKWGGASATVSVTEFASALATTNMSCRPEVAREVAFLRSCTADTGSPVFKLAGLLLFLHERGCDEAVKFGFFKQILLEHEGVSAPADGERKPAPVLTAETCFGPGSYFSNDSETGEAAKEWARKYGPVPFTPRPRAGVVPVIRLRHVEPTTERQDSTPDGDFGDGSGGDGGCD
ncbi:unnamed protein product, partial [Ectocarpus sp. 6 AP-2014]